jgi:phosphoribosylanthranilate isomerase
MPVSAKICGLSTPETLDAAIKHGASHVGLMFFAASPRNLSFDRAAQLAARVPGRISRIGVFVNPDDDLLDAAISAGGLDALQLHKTAPERAAAIKARGLKVWVTIAVKSRPDLNVARNYLHAADKLLYDAKTPDYALPGGMGVRFDWKLLEGFRHPMPWALSGGLDAHNVAAAVRATGATLVDVSSGVESEPGIKDATKIAAFLRAVESL